MAQTVDAGTRARKSSRRRGAAGGAVAQATAYETMMQKMGKDPDTVGRPAGSVEVSFSMKDKDRNLSVVAKRRALTVVHAEQRDRLRELFEQEYAALAARQGYEEVVVRERAIRTERRPV